MAVDEDASRSLLDGQPPKAGACGTWSVVAVYMGAGTILVGTYVWGVVTLFDRYGSAMRLWGGIGAPGKEWLLQTYYASILAATIGFFPSLGYALKIAPRLPRRDVSLICGAFLGFYVTEMAWMPMCVAYIREPREWLYIAIRLQLAVSGVLAILWLVAKCRVPADVAAAAGPCLRVSGLLGTLVFALHCAVLDAIIWPPFFK